MLEIRRREFVALLGGAAAAWPLAARAQQGNRVRRIGVLMGLDENDPLAKAYVYALMKALADLGWAEGRNVRIDLRWAGNEFAPPDFEHRLPLDRTVEIEALSAPLCSAQRIPPRGGGR